MSGNISVDECELLLSFAALDMSVDDRRRAFRDADVVLDGSLTRLEFCRLCQKELGHVPISQIEAGVRNLSRAKVAIRNRWQAKWKRVADRIDTYARFTIPPVYIFAMLVLFHVDLTDDYLINPERQMNDERGISTRLSSRGIILACVFVFGTIVVAFVTDS